MNFDLSEEQILIRDSAARAVREFCELGRRRERIAGGEGFDPDFWAQFAELGWTALCIAEDAGGLGGSPIDIATLMIELGRGAASEPIISSAIVCAELLVATQWGGRAAWIERLLCGEVTLALAGPGDGMTGDAIVVRRLGGKSVLSGASLLVFDGDSAQGYCVAARDETSGETVLAFIPAGSGGLDVQPYRLHDGSRAADIVFGDVELVDGYVMGRGAIADAMLSRALSNASLYCQAAAVGSMEACVELCGDYAATRVQFGQPIGKFQAIQHILADMLVATHNARSLLYFALSRTGEDDQRRIAAIAKAGNAIGQAGLMVSRQGIQIHGGYGMTDEFAIGHHHRYQFVLEKRISGYLAGGGGTT